VTGKKMQEVFHLVTKKKKKESGRRLYNTTGCGEGVNGIPILQDYRILVLKQFTNQSSLIKTVVVIVVEEHIQVKVIIQERHIAIKHQGIVR